MMYIVIGLMTPMIWRGIIYDSSVISTWQPLVYGCQYPGHIRNGKQKLLLKRDDIRESKMGNMAWNSKSILGWWSVKCLFYNRYCGIILCMRPANERRRYVVTSSLIGWAHTQKYPCIMLIFVLSIVTILPKRRQSRCSFNTCSSSAAKR